MIQLIACKASHPWRCMTIKCRLQSAQDTNSFKALVCSLILGSVLIISGCTTSAGTNSGATPSSPSYANSYDPANPVAPADRTIIQDLVEVTAQIFSPLNTTLQINSVDTDPALAYFVGAFSEKGFGIQRVRADQGAHYFSYTRTEKEINGIPGISYSASVGAVEISRDYTLPQINVVAPASPVKLSGTRVAVDVLDVASGRKQVPDRSMSTAQYFASLSLDEQTPIISLITPDIVDRVATQSAQGPSLQGLNSSSIEVNNLFYGDESTFSSILDSYEKIDRQIIVFGNDSMILGNTNKLLIDQFVEQRLGGDDIVGLVGCSNGPTALSIGNEGLALGRAKRVTQALLSRGVPREQVLDEGCWAPVNASDRFPSRGVVLELWRRNS